MYGRIAGLSLKNSFLLLHQALHVTKRLQQAYPRRDPADKPPGGLPGSGNDHTLAYRIRRHICPAHFPPFVYRFSHDRYTMTVQTPEESWPEIVRAGADQIKQPVSAQGFNIKGPA